jgi:hypothetical protein
MHRHIQTPEVRTASADIARPDPLKTGASYGFGQAQVGSKYETRLQAQNFTTRNLRIGWLGLSPLEVMLSLSMSCALAPISRRRIVQRQRHNHGERLCCEPYTSAHKNVPRKEHDESVNGES